MSWLQDRSYAHCHDKDEVYISHTVGGGADKVPRSCVAATWTVECLGEAIFERSRPQILAGKTRRD